MKDLFLMRHGKSSWELNVNDQDRALSQRGVFDAHLIGSKFAEQNLKIEYAFSSPANRALHTASICLQELGHSFGKFSISPELYDFSGNQVLNFIKNIGNSIDTVIIFGHNHAFTHLANMLGDRHITNVPTSGLVHLRFNETTWQNITKGNTVQTIFPKQFKE
ncbi:SixA phosphatase family protein [Maribacter sp. CXY002]|uniref:SixA phosphatase family protein n=1 Tax=Maribacter luteocoastalis TaxID=3407671 RepID=UPI003B67F689